MKLKKLINENNLTGPKQIKERFQASGLDKRALKIIGNKASSDLKNAISTIVYEMADDGFDENETLNFFDKLVYAEVKVNYRKAVK